MSKKAEPMTERGYIIAAWWAGLLVGAGVMGLVGMLFR